jgi:hypothetical protein
MVPQPDRLFIEVQIILVKLLDESWWNPLGEMWVLTDLCEYPSVFRFLPEEKILNSSFTAISAR